MGGDTFVLVGSWDDWQGFTELRPQRTGACSARIVVRQPPGIEEFQILQNRDWSRRFCPSSDGLGVIGPGDVHGKNWRATLPPECHRIEILWYASGARRVEWKFLAESGETLRAADSRKDHSSVRDVSPEPPFFLAGSWNGWKGFTMLRPAGTSHVTYRATVKVGHKVEEFQVVQSRDWERRFHPAPGLDSEVLGPDNNHGVNWRVEIPASIDTLEVTWDPHGPKSIQWSFPGAADRHLRAAEAFAALMLQMRSESPSGSGWLRGMARIFGALPTCQQHSPYRERAESTATAECLLATLTRDTETLTDAKGPAQPFQRDAFIRLAGCAEEELSSIGGPLDHPADEGGDWMQEAVPADEAAPDEYRLTLFQRLGYLPLVMYVRNTVHLYEMLDRLKAQAHSRCDQGRLRKLLDGVGTERESPYSWLIYGVIGALQTLLRVRRRMGGDAFPIELLASSPPQTVWLKNGEVWSPDDQDGDERGAKARFTRGQCPNCQPMLPVGTYRKKGGLMYRGIWLPAGINADAVRLQYSFQSFSRSIQGVMRVLKFYSGVANTKAFEAAQAGRILIYVARDWPGSPWVTPVQFFDGPKKKAEDSEEELLLPPFMRYELEDEWSVDASMELHEKQRCVEELEEHWKLSLPEKLKQFTFGLLPHLNHTQTPPVKGSANVSLRFIRDMAPAPPIARLFEDEACHLYAWKPAGDG